MDIAFPDEPVRRNAFRIDIKRAALAIGTAVTVAGATFFFALAPPLTQGEIKLPHGFGYDSRTGQIVLVPLVGEDCRQFSFNNDTGFVGEGPVEPCDTI